MSFKLTIRNVPDKELGPIISRLQLPRGVTYDAKYVSDYAVPTKKKLQGNSKNLHSRAASLLTMTGKTAKKGSIIEQGMVLFEKLEKRQGIGTVTVRDFRETLVNNGHPSAVAQRSVTEKFLSYLDG